MFERRSEGARQTPTVNDSTPASRAPAVRFRDLDAGPFDQQRGDEDTEEDGKPGHRLECCKVIDCGVVSASQVAIGLVPAEDRMTIKEWLSMRVLLAGNTRHPAVPSRGAMMTTVSFSIGFTPSTTGC